MTNLNNKVRSTLLKFHINQELSRFDINIEASKKKDSSSFI